MFSVTRPTLFELKAHHSLQTASIAVLAPLRLFFFTRAFASLQRGCTAPPAAAAAAAVTAAAQPLVRAPAPTCVYLKPERGVISLSSMPQLQHVILQHLCCSPQGALPQLLSRAKFKPIGKLRVTSSRSGGIVSYHIPAASSIEMQLTTVAAVSSVLKVFEARPLKLPCIVLSGDTALRDAHASSSPAACAPRTWSTSHEVVSATAAVPPHGSALFFTTHVKQRMLQRGIRPSDIVDAISTGKVMHASKQNVFFQTKKGLRVITDGQCKVAVTAFNPQAKQHVTSRHAETATHEDACCEKFLSSKRGWSLRPKV